MDPATTPDNAIIHDLEVRVGRVKAALGSPAEEQLVRDCLAAIERAGIASWRKENLLIFRPSPVVVGLIMLSGQRDRYADIFERLFIRDLPPHGPLRSVPASDWQGTEASRMGWVRIIRGDWRALETRRRPSAFAENELVRPLLEAASRGDRERALRIAQRAADAHDDPRPSLFVTALDRLLPDRPDEGRDVALRAGMFLAEGDERIASLAGSPLRRVLAIEHPRASGGPADNESAERAMTVERLACGHRRAERRLAWRPAQRRRCPLCRDAAQGNRHG